MTLTLLEHSEQIVKSFESIIAAMDILTHHIQAELKDFPIWAQTTENNFDSNRNKLVYALRKFESDFNAPVQETFSFCGAIAGTQKTLELVSELNKTKDAFKSKVIEYHRSPAYHYTVPARKILTRYGYSGIKLKQVYRHIVTLDFNPKTISWCEAIDSSHKVINQTAAELLLSEFLNKHQDETQHIEIQLKQVRQLSAGETLVIRRDLKAHPMANISKWENSRPIKIRSSLPIVFLYDYYAIPTIVRFSSRRKASTQRSDKLLEDTPFLKSIHAYRYKKLNI